MSRGVIDKRSLIPSRAKLINLVYKFPLSFSAPLFAALLLWNNGDLGVHEYLCRDALKLGKNNISLVLILHSYSAVRFFTEISGDM